MFNFSGEIYPIQKVFEFEFKILAILKHFLKRPVAVA
jgi:hypothetical protein